MHIGVPAETYPGETRVAATPETVKKLVAAGRHQVSVQAGAGLSASIRDEDFRAAGAAIVPTAADAYAADIVLKVRRPLTEELPLVKKGSLLVGLLSPHEGVDDLASTGATAFAMELLPASRARRPWTSCPRRATSPATGPCSSGPTNTAASCPC